MQYKSSECCMERETYLELSIVVSGIQDFMVTVVTGREEKAMV